MEWLLEWRKQRCFNKPDQHWEVVLGSTLGKHLHAVHAFVVIVMIDDLSVPTSANFHSIRKKLSNRSIDDLFVKLRANHSVTARNEFKYTRELLDDVRWSAICFRYENSPSFLESTTAIRESLYGFMLLIEHQGYAAVLTSRLNLPSVFKTTYFSPVASARVEGAIAKADAVFQRMTMRNMSISPYAMRSKTVDAADLANVVGPAGSRRYAPRTYSVVTNGIQSTATPSTGRIGVRSARTDLPGVISFAKYVIEELGEDNANVSPFIRSFARPLSLTEALESSEPQAMAIDTTKLADAVDDVEEGIRLIRLMDDGAVELSADEITTLMERLSNPLNIEGDVRLRAALDPATGDQCASICLNKNRIALRSLSSPQLSDVYVESAGEALGEDGERQTLRAYLDSMNALIVLFEDVRLAYIDGQVFRDETLVNGGESFLRHFSVCEPLSAVTSEKGEFTAEHTAFDGNSSFGATIDHIAAADPILLCDDLGDEWADFIGISDDAGATQISFYHAKHGALSLGASPFHVSVSQAVKNLGNMSFPEERIAGKVELWSSTYNAPNQQTQIHRTIRSNVADLTDALHRARTAPDARRRAVIVTSSLSRQALVEELTAIQGGQRPSPSFVQLYWLMQSFFSACTEVGATGTVVCQP
ncbi:hypothetical protein KUV51_00350 [Tateyamaria omphalii]|uniref:hypothetical protein n=1 Tax=Tateyamaria omphalii TaxID=299262 RepID=UPI001C9A28A6|nr:hypothetical protein [Tateyamaria omphalii]MBY5931431.1 hypothetical protein [Tateyamaria omphalii]